MHEKTEATSYHSDPECPVQRRDLLQEMLLHEDLVDTLQAEVGSRCGSESIGYDYDLTGQRVRACLAWPNTAVLRSDYRSYEQVYSGVPFALTESGKPTIVPYRVRREHK
jgi:hypothetical protein